jgi:hypothetical protein
MSADDFLAPFEELAFGYRVQFRGQSASMPRSNDAWRHGQATIFIAPSGSEFCGI